MRKKVIIKLNDQESRIVIPLAQKLGVSLETLTKQSLFFSIQELARRSKEKLDADRKEAETSKEVEVSTGSVGGDESNRDAEGGK